jgi:DNA mismatch repair protein MutS
MPYQYGKLNKSYNLIIKVINNSKVVFKNNKLLNDKFNYDKLLLFKKYYDKYINYFNITNLESYSYNSNLNNIISNTLEKIGKDIKNNAKDDIKDTIKNNNYLKCFNIFNQGIISEIDDIENEIIDNVHKLYELTNIFSNIVNSREKGGDNLNNFLNSKSKIKLFNIKYTDRDGYYISSTNTRALKLKKIIQEEYEVINNSLNNSLNNCIIGELSYIKKTQSSTYITSNYIKNISNELIKLEDKLNNLIKQKYLEIIMKLYIEFKDILIYVKKFIEFIDFITNLSYISIKYNYNKPEIENNKLSKQSFISSEQIRHPIVEQIMDDVIYVTNNIDINLDKTGALIYGINGSGKSTIMKSIGLNLILAQIGCYTASKTFKYYPYTNLFTRIDHSDNLFKGLSSFESEIIELKTILKYANSNSLVLGDEILNSTENISAISLISASINHFINNNISFIFASHLHQIPESINKDIIDKLYIGHLKSDFDSKTQLFIYNRKLNAGMSILNYGLLVAKSLLDESSIINDALDIQNKILNKENNSLGSKILENKKSVYNSKLYMNECYICKDLGLPKYDNQILDTHHINEQNTFKKNGLTEICIDENLAYIKKNNRYNLVNLCKLHHIKIHNNQITINGWIKTTNGRKLDYTIIN